MHNIRKLHGEGWLKVVDLQLLALVPQVLGPESARIFGDVETVSNATWRWTFAPVGLRRTDQCVPPERRPSLTCARYVHGCIQSGMTQHQARSSCERPCVGHVFFCAIVQHLAGQARALCPQCVEAFSERVCILSSWFRQACVWVPESWQHMLHEWRCPMVVPLPPCPSGY